jgi:hypothetical protein
VISFNRKDRRAAQGPQREEVGIQKSTEVVGETKSSKKL